MCGSKRDAVESIQINLNYVKEDVNSALSYATEVGDPELTKKLTEIKDKAQGVKDYITSKTDSKTG
jgi:hypothetical protein